ncbi:MAG: single-stranded DNA-binding protein [Bacilli bacterium]|nr:single-stranded DNA-binding protein [Bacilli bacterium]
MLNQMVVVGRLVRDPELRETETGKKVTNITLAVPRSYKNTKGEYETDFIDCVLWTGIAESTTEYCKKGDIIGIKGRIQTRNIEVGENKRKYITEVVAEKVTFLSSKQKNGEE